MSKKEGRQAFASYTDTYYDNCLQEAEDFFEENNIQYFELEKRFKTCLSNERDLCDDKKIFPDDEESGAIKASKNKEFHGAFCTSNSKNCYS